jgi:hypothetical protein
MPPVVVLVPAHNEECFIGATIQSLLNCDYIGEVEVIVIADNCTDATAAVAGASGVTVLSRDDPTLRGKSFALQFALDALGKRPSQPQAVVVVDADTVVEPNFLQCIGSRLVAGAAAVQVHYRAADGPGDLIGIRRLALSLVHWSRPLGLSRLGLGGGLKGNGMAFRWDAAEVALARNGLAEDAAATLALARAGIAVTFEPLTSVAGFMAGDYRSASVQDARWESGRMGLVSDGLKAAAQCARYRRPRLLPAVFEAIGLPLTLLFLMGAAGTMAGLAGFGSTVLAVVSVGSVGTYIAIGLAAARPSSADLKSLKSVPKFLLYKVLVFSSLATRRTGANWRRTARD